MPSGIALEGFMGWSSPSVDATTPRDPVQGALPGALLGRRARRTARAPGLPADAVAERRRVLEAVERVEHDDAPLQLLARGDRDARGEPPAPAAVDVELVGRRRHGVVRGRRVR